VIVLNDTGLQRILKSCFDYYERTRTPLSLDKDAPISSSVQPPEIGRIVEVPQVGGLHHRHERILNGSANARMMMRSASRDVGIE